MEYEIFVLFFEALQNRNQEKRDPKEVEDEVKNNIIK